MERTLVILKPDAVRRKLIGEILVRFERADFSIVSLSTLRPTRQMFEKHYDAMKEKDYFPLQVDFMMSGPVVVAIIEGHNAISAIREMVGATYPKDRRPGTIRGDYSMQLRENLVHASDSPETAEREIDLWSVYLNE